MNYQHAKVFRAGPAFFVIACLLYFVGSNYFDSSTLARLSIVSLTIGLFFGLVFGDTRRISTLTTPLVVMAILAAFNIMVSTNTFETAIRWAIWFQMFIAMGLLATNFDDLLDHSIMTLVPFGAAVIWLSKYLHAGNDSDLVDAAKVLHLSAFFASVTVATSLFHPSKAIRIMLCAIGVYGVLSSGSRAAILFLPLQFSFALLYYNRNKFLALATFLLPISILAAALYFEPLRDVTFGKKASAVGRESFEDAASSLEDRGYLRMLAYDFISERPFGYGYGNTYNIPGAKKDRGTNFHNGFLNVVVSMGVHIGLIYGAFLSWIGWSLYTRPFASRKFRHFFLAVLLAGGIRSFTEDFTLFDLGNPISYLIVYLSFVYVNRTKHSPIRAGI